MRMVSFTLALSLCLILSGNVAQSNFQGNDSAIWDNSDTDIFVDATSINSPVSTAMQADTPANSWESMPTDTHEAILGQLHQAEYQPRPLEKALPGTCSAINRAQALSLTFDTGAVRVLPVQFNNADPAADWNLALSLTGYGYGETLESALPATPTISGNRVEYHRGDLSEWYRNDERGLEQGFTLTSPPTAEAGKNLPLCIGMAIDTSLTPLITRDEQVLFFCDTQGKAILDYGELHAYDADGEPLVTQMSLGNEVDNTTKYNLYLMVDDSDAKYPITVDPLLTQVAKLTASDASAYSSFGYAVSISGDTLVVGACGDDSNTGSAYVFERNEDGADNWGEVTKLTASDSVQNAYFGWSVSISGDTLVVGAYGTGSESGSAYVFERNQGGADNWGQVKKLTASDAAASDSFGYAVSISDAIIVVGAPNDNVAPYDFCGSAYVFERNQGGADNWGEIAKLVASDPSSWGSFGWSVSISGDTVVVGAFEDDAPAVDSGSAYVFERNEDGADNWGEVTKLIASDYDAEDRFGYAVSISNDTIVVGAKWDDNEAGSAYVFERNEDGADNWGEVGQLVASDAAMHDNFGYAVSISIDTIVVSAPFKNNYSGPGSAYVFERNEDGADNWGEVKILDASDAAWEDYFGRSVCISGDSIVVGADGDDDGGSQSGSAYTFVNCDDGGWAQEKKNTASDPAANDYFGYAVSVSGDTIVVGAVYNDDDGSDSGSAYVFERNQDGADSWGEVQKLTASDAAAYDYFGYYVSISGDTIVVGAVYNDDGGSDSGSAYVFERNQDGADSWGEVQKLTASDAAANDHFGYAVSISGDTIVVGVTGDDDTAVDSGSAYVFERNEDGADNWGEVAKLTASDAAANDHFGYAVSISGDTLVVGASGDDSNTGSAYVFKRNEDGADNWGEVAKLTASDSAENDNFGYAVSISGDTIVVGALYNDDTAVDSGSAYVFKRNEDGADNWGEVAKLTASDAAAYNYFGRSVSISCDTIVVGVSGDDSNTGSAYVFERNQDGADNWGEVAKLTASDAAANDYFGYAVSISGDTLVVSAYLDDDTAVDSGSAYVFYLICNPDLPLVSINLLPGWNLISLPLIPDNSDIDAVISDGTLSSGDHANVVIVYYFDTTAEEWLWWNGSQASTLSIMEDGRGYWVYADVADNLNVDGIQAGHPGQDYSVFAGGNMVGFTSTTNMAPEAYLISEEGNYTLLYRWADGLWLWWIKDNPSSTLTNMQSGYGYWLYMDTDGTITPP
jgi:hypothetical protein